MMAWIFPNQLEGPSKGPKGVCEYPELERQMDQQTQRLADLASKTIRPIMKDRGLLNKPFESSKRGETYKSRVKHVIRTVHDRHTKVQKELRTKIGQAAATRDAQANAGAAVRQDQPTTIADRPPLPQKAVKSRENVAKAKPSTSTARS